MEQAKDVPEKFNCATYSLGRMAAAHPDDIAILVFDGSSYEPTEKWTYATLEDAVLRTTNGLRSIGLKLGDRVLLRMGNTAWFPITFLACLAGGFVPIPTSDRHGSETLDHIATDSRPVAILHDGATKLPRQTLSSTHILGPADLTKFSQGPLGLYAKTLSYDPAFLIYSDGRSKPPCGILHAHRAIWGRQQLQKEWLDLRQKDRFLHPGAQDWSTYCTLGILDPLCKGAATILFSAPNSGTIYGKALPALIELTKATIVAAKPHHYRDALNSNTPPKTPLNTLRLSLSSGSYLPDYLAHQWMTTTNKPLYNGYDLAEIACPISWGPYCTARSNRLGKPHSGRKIAVLPLDGGLKNLTIGESGMIAVHRSDPALMLGYWNNISLTKASVRGAWFLTGDLGRRDKDGYIQYEGRFSDLISIEDNRLNPEDIEAKIASLPGIDEVAIVKSLAPGLGTSLIAFIVAETGAQLTIPKLNQAIAPLLESHKRPKQWIEVDALPKTASGKIARSVLNQFVT